MQMEKRFRTSHVDPITVATRGRVSPAISGNSNFKSRFRDYRAGNESVKEKRYEEMEGEREREREEQKYTVGRWLEGKHGSVTAADHSVESFCRWSKSRASEYQFVRRVADILRHVTLIAVRDYQTEGREVFGRFIKVGPR